MGSFFYKKSGALERHKILKYEPTYYKFKE